MQSSNKKYKIVFLGNYFSGFQDEETSDIF